MRVLIINVAKHAEPDHLIPVTLELGGKSPNIFFADVMAEDDDFLDKTQRERVLAAWRSCPRLFRPDFRLRPKSDSMVRVGEGAKSWRIRL